MQEDQTKLRYLATAVTRAGLWCLGPCILYLFYQAFFHAPIPVDTGTYLSIANRIASGAVLYRDLANGCTPAVFYMAAFARFVISWPILSYDVYNLLYFCFTFGTAYLVFLILRRYCLSVSLAILGSCSTLLAIYTHEGDGFTLEPFVTFFALLAYYFTLRPDFIWQIFFSGVAASLAFLCKQYGGLAFLAIPASLVLRNNHLVTKRKQLAFFGGGVLLPLVGCAIYFISIENTPIRDLVHQLTPMFYLTGGRISVVPYLGLILSQGAPLLIVPLAMGISSDYWRRHLLSLVSCCLLFSIPLMIRQFAHYHILFLPFLVTLEILCLSILTQRFACCVLLVPIFVILKVFDAASTIVHTKNRNNLREVQYQVGSKINSIWKPSTEVLLFGQPTLMYICQFNPIDPRLPSYSFLSNYEHATQLTFISHSNQVLVDPAYGDYFDQSGTGARNWKDQLLETLTREKFSLIGIIDNRILLWERKKTDGAEYRQGDELRNLCL